MLTAARARFPRLRLIPQATALQHLPRLSQHLGRDTWIKRDDLTPLEPDAHGYLTPECTLDYTRPIHQSMDVKTIPSMTTALLAQTTKYKNILKKYLSIPFGIDSLAPPDRRTL